MGTEPSLHAQHWSRQTHQHTQRHLNSTATQRMQLQKRRGRPSPHSRCAHGAGLHTWRLQLVGPEAAQIETPGAQCAATGARPCAGPSHTQAMIKCAPPQRTANTHGDRQGRLANDPSQPAGLQGEGASRHAPNGRPAGVQGAVICSKARATCQQSVEARCEAPSMKNSLPSLWSASCFGRREQPWRCRPFTDSPNLVL